MKFDAIKKKDLLFYVESIAVVYYQKHKVVFEKDSVSLNDLKQEAKIICLKMIKEWGKKDGKLKFDIKKFISRAVGWRMRDLLNGAIVQSKNTLHLSELAIITSEGESNVSVPESFNIAEYSHWEKEDFFTTLEPELVHGFNIKDVLSEFKGKDLTILKKMIECKSIKSIQKDLGYKNNNSIREAWQNRILPKLKVLLCKSIKEYKE